VIAWEWDGRGVVPALAVENLGLLDLRLDLAAGPAAKNDDLVPRHHRRPGGPRMKVSVGRPAKSAMKGGKRSSEDVAAMADKIAVIMGNIGVSPITATAITGLALTMDPTNVFSTSQQVIGKAFAADYASPTPANLTTAVGDMELAFTDAAGRAPNVTELGAGNIGGKTLVPGVYKWGTGLLIPTNVTLSGGATDVWIFEIAQNLNLSSATNVVLKGGARPENIFWQVSGGVTLDSTAHLEGIVLSKTAITLGTKASVHGRLLSQTAVTLINNTIVQP
jgi:hypothetical protein